MESIHEAEFAIALEPVRNALNSFALLNVADEWVGLNSWVVRTARRMSGQQRYTNRLLFEGLPALFFADAHADDFPAYLDRLIRQDAPVLRDQYLRMVQQALGRHFAGSDTGKHEDDVGIPTRNQLLKDGQRYVSCMQYLGSGQPFDRQLHAEVHALLNDAPALQQLIVSHLTFLWDDAFATEWKRVQRTLQNWTEMYRYSMEPGWTLSELFYTFTGRRVDAALIAQADGAQQITVVPSWHGGWHVVSRQSEAGLLIFFSEPANYNNAEVRKTAMGQSELLARLSALGDSTRLRIIELLMQRDEWEAQEIIAELELSQSSVSRHLKQLVSLGYLYERRGEGANKTYRLGSFFFERTARAIERLVAGERFQVETKPEKELDQELRRFVDEQGRLTLWPPARERDKVLIMNYLGSFFAPGREYSEKEVNDLLTAHSVVQDAAALRRAMQEYHVIERRRDGSAYWLAGTILKE